jgi:hypothetical protein
MYEMTVTAQGTKLKGGATRRIVVTMDEKLFFDIKAFAIEDGRSISSEIVHRLQRSFTWPDGQ